MQAAPSPAPQSVTSRFWSRALTAALLRFAAGVGAGCCLTAALWSFWSQWGSGLNSGAGLTLATVAAIAIGLRASQWRHTFQFGWAPVWCGLAVALATAPLLASTSLDALQWIPVGALENSIVATTLATGAALLCVGPTVGLLCVLIAGPKTEAPCGITDPLRWSGLALSLLIIPLTLAPSFGIQMLGWLAAGASLIAAIVAAHRGITSAAAPAEPHPVVRRQHRRHRWHLTDLGHIGSGVVVGIGCALSLQINSQLQPGMAFVVFAALGGLCSGIAVGMCIRTMRGALPSVPAGYLTGAGMLASAVAVALLAVLFGRLTDLHLWLSATESRVWMLLAARALQAALPMLPFGLALAMVTDERPQMVRGYFRSDLSLVACAGAAGFLMFRGWGPEPARFLPWFLLFGCGLSLLFLRAALFQTNLRRPAIVAAGVGLVVTAGGFWFSSYDPARSARLLYSANTFAGYRRGLDAETLAVLDDGRCIQSRNSGRSTWTVWKHHGALFQLRENGIPRHLLSTDLAICPQSSAELLPVVAPLVVHPQPRHVLITELGSTAVLQSCLAFPITSVTCTESDPALLEFANSLIPSETGSSSLDDDRVRLLTIDAPLIAAADDQRYDVIIVPATQPSLFSEVSTSTTDYYRRLADKLQPGGILCQRFQYVDFGAAPLQNMAATLSAVFTQVRMLESAPGELLLLACADDGPTIDAGLANRAEAPQVRRLMSQAGWDWSVLLGLAAVNDDATAEVAAKSTHANRAADGRTAFAMAPEVARWGPKLDEIRELLTARSSPMLTWIGECTEADDVSKRLADVKEQRRVINECPEQFWEYRKSLKERLQNRPRSMIVPVSHEGLKRRLHPEDERRKQYLVALGNAARQSQPDLQSIRRVAGFVEPYDPLVSFFAHHEAAHLLARAARPDRQAELAHRLHTVYYGAGTDRSVRNVADSLTLLIDAPDSVDSPQARWDHINALLEVLRHRWSERLPAREKSRYAAADIDESLQASRRALRVMDGLAAELQIDSTTWRHRRDLLERELVQRLSAAQQQQAQRPQPRSRVAPPPAS